MAIRIPEVTLERGAWRVYTGGWSVGVDFPTEAAAQHVADAIAEAQRTPTDESGEPRFDTMDLIDSNVEDLRREIDDLDHHRGRLVAIIDEEAGGIIAYAIGDDHAALLAKAANRSVS